MRTVNIAVLKNQAQQVHHLRQGRGDHHIRDRNTAVAQIIPSPQLTASPTKSATRRRRILRMPEKPWDIKTFDHLRCPKVEGNALTQALLDEREEGR